jgi:hypothetical protein
MVAATAAPGKPRDLSPASPTGYHLASSLPNRRRQLSLASSCCRRSISNSSSVVLAATLSNFLRLVGPRTSVTALRGMPSAWATAWSAA